MIFCTKCGHQNLAGSRFCEECGSPFAQAAAQQPQAHVASNPASTSPRAPGKKLGLYIGAGVAAMVVLGAALAFFLVDQAPSKEVFAKAIERSLISSPPIRLKPHYCLDNFPYDKDPVHVNSNNQSTRRWLSVLTTAGLYSEPKVVNDFSGFFVTTSLVYKKSEAGIKATQGSQLCIADGLTVVRVESFTPPEKLGESEVSMVVAKLALRNPMPWVGSEETRELAPAIGVDFDASFLLGIKDGKWAVADEKTISEATQVQRNQNKNGIEKRAASESTGFFDSLKKLFSWASANPLIGRWEAKEMGQTISTMEFEADTMIADGHKTAVRFEVEDKRVTIYRGDDADQLVVDFIDKDTVTIGLSFVKLRFTRVK
jgi:hypothetical protein